jgi:uncharacterized protein (TIGR03437 family)
MKLEAIVDQPRVSWLTVSPFTGETPALLEITADPSGLNPGDFTSTITINVPLADPAVQTIPVVLHVGPPLPPKLVADRDHLSFTYSETSTARSQNVTLSNPGGGAVPFTTSITLGSGQSAKWLSVSPTGGTVTPSSPVVLNVQASANGLSPGTYTGQVTIAGTTPGTGSVTIPVAMTITTNPLILLLSQTGLTFTAVQNGGVIPGQTFGVLNLGAGALNWTVQTSTLAGGNWLVASPNNGSSNAGSTSTTPLVTVSVKPAGLKPDVYYGLVKVISSGAANTPQEVVVVLQVLPAGTDVAPIVQPSAMVFTGTVGKSSPSSQNVMVYDPTGTSKSFRSGKTTESGGSWFVTLPGDATVAPDQPSQIVVQPVVDNLAAGTYQGTLTLQFSDGRVSAVGITFIVTGAGSGGTGSTAVSRSAIRPADTAAVCNPKELRPTLISLGMGFNVPAGLPQGLEAQVTDNCGTPHMSGTVFVQFDNGDSPIKLSSLNNGRWDGTWQTSTKQVSQVTLRVIAQNPQLLVNGMPISGENDVMGGLGAPQPAPVVLDTGVVSAASLVPQVPLAPGGLISIFGQRLSEGKSFAPSGTLPQELGSTIVTIGDQILPLLYASTDQVNAIVPYTVSTNTNQQLLVQRGLTYATPISVDVALSQPAVFQNGQQGIIRDANGNLIGPSNPAHVGDSVAIFCAGLGQVTPAVKDGVITPDMPFSSTVSPVTVTIGGQNATVSFAGLAPGFTGWYRINATVPQGISLGDHVPVQITTGEQAGRFQRELTKILCYLAVTPGTIPATLRGRQRRVGSGATPA